MFRTFGEQLLQFARAVDIVRDPDFRDIRGLVSDYLHANFGVDKVDFLRETRIEGEQGLAPQWDDSDSYGAYPLVRDGKPYGQNALAFQTGDPLWIIAKDEGVLAESSEYVDLWSHRSDIPRFVRFSDPGGGGDKTRMLVSVPIELRKTRIGVLYCESDEIYSPNDAAKTEFNAIAGSLGLLYTLKNQVEATHQNTVDAIGELRGISTQPVEFKVTKPRLYLAYGNDRDPEVLGIIGESLDKYQAQIERRDWGREHPPGDITKWITDEIVAAKYLLCYLSDRIEDGQDVRFQDNPNVIFETGMFHALRESTDITARQWLPIREGSPEEAPFDFRPVRMVAVPRDANGALKQDAFRASLDASLRELVRDDLAAP